MQYGILEHNNLVEYFEKEVNSCKYCKDCRAERLEYKKNDQKFGLFSNLLPGFSSKTIKLPVDVLIIAEAHGGRENLFRPQKNIYEEVKELGDYYRVEKLKKYHQQEMRDLFNRLEEKNLEWVFADLTRCFVWQGKINNTRKAINNCRKYMDKEIEYLKPKIIVCLGKRVAEEYFGIAEKLIHGNIYKDNIVWSYFPGRNTADIWVEHGGWVPILEQINNIRK
jgi:hypothetical protein